MDRRTFISRAIGLTAVPVLSDTHAKTAGGVLTVEHYQIPAWAPAVGVIADVSLNTMSDVRGSDPDPSMQYNYWAGCAYARDYGEKGTLIFNAGGHTATLTNYVYGYDVAARRHFMERQSPRHYLATDGYVADTVTGWLWADTSGTKMQEGETFAYHSYSFMTWLPPKSIPGGRAPNGWLFTPGRASMCAKGQRGTRQAHKLALGLGLNTPYEMHGSLLPHNANHFFALYDSTRNRVVWFGYLGDFYPKRNLYYMDIGDASQGKYTWPSFDDAIFPYYCIGKHAEVDDVYLITRLEKSTWKFWVFDPRTSRLFTPTTSGDQPMPANDCAVEWVEAWRALVYFNPNSSIVWILSAPEDPRIGTWTWSERRLTGKIRQPTQAIPAYTRLTYIRDYDLFLWPASHLAPMQGFRLTRPHAGVIREVLDQTLK